tara:strand:- start:2664 stop:3602 length:939 start_codon:yes stop_codon:yes gene_type:complete
MQNTERLFIILLIVVGLLFLYILSIFFSPGEHLLKQPIEPILIEDEIDNSEDDEDNYEQDSKTVQFSRMSRSSNLNSGDSDEIRSRRNVTSFRNISDLKKYERELQKSKPAAIIPLSTRQNRLRASLIERGYENEEFLQFMMLALDDDSLLDAETKANHFLELNQFEKAIEIYEEAYEESDEENRQIKASIAEKIIEIGLMSGNIKIVSKYSNKYFDELQAILDIYKKSQIMKFSKGRDKIYSLEQALKAGKSGSIIVFMQALKSGQLKPREIVTGLKAAARMDSKNGYKMSNADIAAAEKTSYQIFSNYSR